MSKARDKALEAFPISFSGRTGYKSANLPNERRNAFEKGYEQAEKDFLDAVYSIEMKVKEGGMFPSADSIPVLSNCDMMLLPKDKFKVGDKIIVQIRKII